jgi:hypothetical protein
LQEKVICLYKAERRKRGSMDRLWDFLIEMLMKIFIPLVCSYYTLSTNVFLNISVQNATGLEKLGNTLLSPVQFILAGREAIEQSDGSWKLVQRFDYDHYFWFKTASSILSLPPSLMLGSAVKGLGLLQETARSHHHSLVQAKKSTQVRSNRALYAEMGINLDGIKEVAQSLGCLRKPGEEHVLAVEKRALQDIAKLLNEANIPWWVDCGTCLGAYRYGGVIPWDGDIDIAVLLPDFTNVCYALNQLDPKKYIVQDWSSRDFPDSYLKVFVRETGNLIDIYHFAIQKETRELSYVLSLENNIFFPDWWKERERRFKVPVSFQTVFPLKKATFDGIEVFIPNDTKKYLQRCYGENLDPVKVYNPETCLYEKDLSHPYWQRAYAH